MKIRIGDLIFAESPFDSGEYLIVMLGQNGVYAVKLGTLFETAKGIRRLDLVGEQRFTVLQHYGSMPLDAIQDLSGRLLQLALEMSDNITARDGAYYISDVLDRLINNLGGDSGDEGGPVGPGDMPPTTPKSEAAQVLASVFAGLFGPTILDEMASSKGPFANAAAAPQCLGLVKGS